MVKDVVHPKMHAVVAVYKAEVLHRFGLVCRGRGGAAGTEGAGPVFPHQKRRNVMQVAVNFHDVVRAFA